MPMAGAGGAGVVVFGVTVLFAGKEVASEWVDTAS